MERTQTKSKVKRRERKKKTPATQDTKNAKKHTNM